MLHVSLADNKMHVSMSEGVAAITVIASLSLYSTLKFSFTSINGYHPRVSHNSSLRNISYDFYSLPQVMTNATVTGHSSEPPTTNDLSFRSRLIPLVLNITSKLTNDSLQSSKAAVKNLSSITQVQQTQSFFSNLSFIILNPKFCVKSKPKVLIWVYSAPPNFERRKSIRKTWGNTSVYSSVNVRVVFSLASTSQSHVQQRIHKEMNQYGDLIQDGSFMDSYRNLSLKAQGMLKWTATYCNDLKLLFKVDDDSFVIPQRLSLWLQEFVKTRSWPYNSILGSVWLNPGPKRYIGFRWKVTRDEWAKSFFAPKACPGLGYFISGDAVRKLKNSIAKMPYLWLEDMYVTGVLAESARLSHKDISVNSHFMYNSMTAEKVLDSKSIFLIGHMPSTDRTYKLWKSLQFGNLTRIVEKSLKKT